MAGVIPPSSPERPSHQVRRSDLPTRWALRLPRLGDAPAKLDACLAAPLARAVTQLHAQPLSAWPELTEHTLTDATDPIALRMSHVPDPRLRARVTRWHRPLLAPLEPQVRGTLVVSHGDLNLTNFIRDSRGIVHLIDLEGVRLAVPEMDAAMLAMTAVFDEAPDLWRELRLRLGPLDPEDFAWCLKQKLAGSLAWAAWQESQGNGEARNSLARREELAAAVVLDPYGLLR